MCQGLLVPSVGLPGGGADSGVVFSLLGLQAPMSRFESDLGQFLTAPYTPPQAPTATANDPHTAELSPAPP